MKAKFKKAFERLLHCAKRGHQTGLPVTTLTREQPWVAADLVAQDALYMVQDDLVGLLYEMARDLDGGTDGATVRHLAAAMPWAFTTTTEARP